MLLETFLASEKLQKNPSKTHIGSNNSHKMGEKVFLVRKLKGKKVNLKHVSLRQAGTLI